MATEVKDTSSNRPKTFELVDHFDELLSLEESFYQQGFQLGAADGSKSGLVEGRLFGMERGFEKFFNMARLHGHAITLGNRFPAVLGRDRSAEEDVPTMLYDDVQQNVTTTTTGDLKGQASAVIGLDEKSLSARELKSLPGSSRLEKHIRSLYALTEPASLSLQNHEDHVSEFDDRFKRAQAKATIVGRMIGEDLQVTGSRQNGAQSLGSADGTRGVENNDQEATIENLRILQAR